MAFEVPEKRMRLPYPAPAPQPTQRHLIEGFEDEFILFDFNEGARVRVPVPWLPRSAYLIQMFDRDDGTLVYEAQLAGAGEARSTKAYWINWRLVVQLLEFAGDNKTITKTTILMDHAYDARDKPVLVQCAAGTIGDTIAWFSYVPEFQRKTGAKVTVAMAAWMRALFELSYPGITFVTHEETDPKLYYSTYKLGLFFGDEQMTYAPVDFRLVGLHRVAAYTLGVNPNMEMPPRVDTSGYERPRSDRYVCIMAQSTSQAKLWNRPDGWDAVVRHLIELGLTPVCIDKERVTGEGYNWNRIPWGCIDETGDKPLLERAAMLRHAQFAIGLSSGLSWLSWAVGTPVIVISGFTHPVNEFENPWRVINYHACNSCWNDQRFHFDHKDRYWCPRQKNTDRQFECTRLITPQQVNNMIDQLWARLEP